MKVPNFGYFCPKIPYFGIFGPKLKKKNSVIFEISILKFVKNENLTDTVNVGKGTAFSKGLGALYKVCPL